LHTTVKESFHGSVVKSFVYMTSLDRVQP